MTELHISSLPLISLTQEAYEHMVSQLHVSLAFEYNVQKRAALLAKMDKAQEMIEHLITIQKNQKD